MSWVIVAVATVSVATTAMGMKQQQDIAENAVKQADMDAIASQSATEQSMQDAEDITQEKLFQSARELLRAKGKAVAIQASTGVAGVVKEKQLRNIDMQNTFDVNKIKQDGDNMIINVANQGSQNAQQIQSARNTAESNRPSNTSIAVSSIASGVGTGLSVYGATKGGKKT